MAVPTVYSWLDSGAPVISNPQDWTQIKAFFDAVFVTGYGAKPALGWTVEYNDTEHHVLLTQGGIGTTVNMVVGLDYGYGRTNSGQVTEYPRAAEYFNLASVDVDSDNNFSNVLLSGNATGFSALGGLSLGDGTTGYICPWMVIGTNRGFYAIGGFNGTIVSPTVPTEITTDTNHSPAVAYFGDYVESLPMGGYNQIASAKQASALYAISTGYDDLSVCMFGGTTAGAIGYIARNADHAFQNQYVWPLSPSSNMGRPQFGWLKYPYVDGGYHFREYEFTGSSDGIKYGKFPGLYHGLHQGPLTGAASVSTLTGTGDYAGHTFYVIGGPDAGELLIDVTADWGI